MNNWCRLRSIIPNVNANCEDLTKRHSKQILQVYLDLKVVSTRNEEYSIVSHISVTERAFSTTKLVSP